TWFFPMTVQQRFTTVAVVPPARGHEEVHDVQPEADVTGTGFLVEQAALGDAADVALLADAGLQRVGVDLDVLVGLGDADGRPLVGPGGQHEGQRQQDGGKDRSHGRVPDGGGTGTTLVVRPWGAGKGKSTA